MWNNIFSNTCAFYKHWQNSTVDVTERRNISLYIYILCKRSKFNVWTLHISYVIKDEKSKLYSNTSYLFKEVL